MGCFCFVVLASIKKNGWPSYNTLKNSGVAAWLRIQEVSAVSPHNCALTPQAIRTFTAERI